jgi:hypothetical protein
MKVYHPFWDYLTRFHHYYVFTYEMLTQLRGSTKVFRFQNQLSIAAISCYIKGKRAVIIGIICTIIACCNELITIFPLEG